MQAWENIGRCIRPVQHPHHVRKNIIPRKHLRTQHHPIGEQGGDDEENCHPDETELGKFVKPSFICKEKV